MSISNTFWKGQSISRYYLCCCSVAQSCPALCDLVDCSTPASLSFTISQSLLRLMFIESVMPSNHLILYHPLSSCLQSLSASGSFLISQIFTSGGQSTGASVSVSVLLMNIQGWFLLGFTGLVPLEVQGTLKSLPQHHRLKASILWCSAFFMVQLLHPSWLLEKPQPWLYCTCQKRPASLGPKDCLHVCVWTQVMSDSLQPHGLQPARLLCSWDFSSKNMGVGCHSLL